MSSSKNREQKLGAVAVAAGEDWLRWWQHALAEQGRSMTGGWPGTLSEARSRVLARAVAALGNDEALTVPELEALAHTTFAFARTGWNARATHDRDA
jgi:hypothetical protein